MSINAGLTWPRKGPVTGELGNGILFVSNRFEVPVVPSVTVPAVSGHFFDMGRKNEALYQTGKT
jgi:hypothetical protein